MARRARQSSKGLEVHGVGMGANLYMVAREGLMQKLALKQRPGGSERQNHEGGELSG